MPRPAARRSPPAAEPISVTQLDRIDRAILKQVQHDASISNVALAQKVKLSAPACLRRVERLKAVGMIRGVVALLDPKAVGAGMLVVIGIVLDRSTPESFAIFEQAIAKLKFVLDCHLVAGDFDYFLKIRVGDMEDFNRIHGEQLIALPGVRQTRTFFVMKEVVDNAALEF